MKKFFYSVLAVVFAALTFTSCDDVPMPYAQPEVNGGGQTYEGAEGDGTLDNPYNVAGALQFISTLEPGVETENQVFIQGVISSIEEEFGSFGNATFHITDTRTNYTFYVYRTLFLNNQKWKSGNTQIKIGDNVIVCGNVVNFRGNTPETVANKSYVYKLNDETSTGGGGGTPGQPSGDGTLNNPYNPTAANQLASALTWTSNTEYQKSDDVYVKGKICKIANNGTYNESGLNGNATFFISEDGKEESEQFQCYRILYLGNKKFASGDTDIKVGDDVVIYGKLMNYKGNTPETVQNEAYLYSLNGTTEGGGGGDQPGGDTPGGDTGSNTTKSVEGTVVTLTDPNATAGESVTVDFNEMGWTNEQAAETINLNDGTVITFQKGSAANPPKFYTATKGVRFYATNGFTITSSSKAIAKVVINCDEYNGTKYVGNEQLYGNVNGNVFTIVNDYTQSSGGVQLRAKTVTIFYVQ